MTFVPHVLALVVTFLALTASGCASMKPLPPGEALTESERRDVIRRASVWSATDIKLMDLKKGPAGEGGFSPDELVTCEFKEREMGGQSRKFACVTSQGAELKVKYGARNAEVYGEVLSTRLFWALGFPADKMYPVRVRCNGCYPDPWKMPKKSAGSELFDPAAIETRLPGSSMETAQDSGWKWSELEDIGPDAPKDARSHRDALKLLAAFIQHSDSRPANQRILCPEGQEMGRTGCRAPVLMVHDLGLTFGRADLIDKSKNSVSFADWAKEPVWKDRDTCVASIKGFFRGHFKNPKISEAGRAFLASLLVQLSDAQLQDLFETARINRRSGDPSADPQKDAPPVPVDEWVRLFKLKRSQVVEHRCSA